jgi:hypothetical protein
LSEGRSGRLLLIKQLKSAPTESGLEERMVKGNDYV